jgi:4-alpha-glucanotransferase
MIFERNAGILLHPTSLPGRFGIGDLGDDAFRLVDFLGKAGQGLWQILPLGPTGVDGCPYQWSSAFAGNPNLISPDKLRDDGLLKPRDLKNVPENNPKSIDYGDVIAHKTSLLKKAFKIFKTDLSKIDKDFDEFCRKNRQWLDDFAFFTAAKQAQKGRSWKDWDEGLVLRRKKSLKEWEKRLADEILFHKFVQFVFFRQWHALKGRANDKKIKIIGDIPIYVAFDSADVWAHRRLFTVARNGEAKFAAGVPPDYYSKTGQRWGNPLYRWKEMEKDDFLWWRNRFSKLFELVDIVRIDHFRGFESFWRIPADEPTAKTGKWVKAPGRKFFKSMKKRFGDVPIIVEDLGFITPSVEKLRDALGFPSMKIMQFAFGKDGNRDFLPHNCVPNCVAMTGGHDNDATRAFFEKAKYKKNDAFDHAQKYLNYFGDDIVFELIQSAYASPANTVVIPMQDILNLGSESRMNTPGKRGGNWMWRFTWDQLQDDLPQRYFDLAKLYDRLPK